MAHELVPRTGKLPSVAEVARLLASEFPHVKVDADDAMSKVQGIAARLDRVNWGRLFPGSEQSVRDRAASLRALPLGEALTIEFGDAPPAGLRTSILVIPGEPIRFGCRRAEEEAELHDLVVRCARVLDCEIVVIWRTGRGRGRHRGRAQARRREPARRRPRGGRGSRMSLR